MKLVLITARIASLNNDSLRKYMKTLEINKENLTVDYRTTVGLPLLHKDHTRIFNECLLNIISRFIGNSLNIILLAAKQKSSHNLIYKQRAQFRYKTLQKKKKYTVPKNFFLIQ